MQQKRKLIPHVVNLEMWVKYCFKKLEQFSIEFRKTKTKVLNYFSQSERTETIQ